MVIGLNLNNNIPLQDKSDYTSVLAALDVLEANGYELFFYIHVKQVSIKFYANLRIEIF